MALEVLGKQILILLDTGAHYSVLPDIVGKPSSQTTIVVGLDGKNEIVNFTPPLLCHIETQFFMHRFLIVSSCPAPLLGWNIMKKLGVVLIMSHLPGILMLQKGPKRVHKSL
jgi:hypothetical protein